MSLRPIVFACGHQLVDNGVGDYLPRCPTAPGDRSGLTVYLDQAARLVSESTAFTCGKCGARLGECTDRGVFGGAR